MTEKCVVLLENFWGHSTKYKSGLWQSQKTFTLNEIQLFDIFKIWSKTKGPEFGIDGNWIVVDGNNLMSYASARNESWSGHLGLQMF